MILRYVGNGDFIPDLNGELVPARDLTDSDIAHFGEAVLIKSGLYVKYEQPTTKSRSRGDESKRGD